MGTSYAFYCDHPYPRAFSAGQKVGALPYDQLVVRARKAAQTFLSRLDKEQPPTERAAFCMKTGYMRSFIQGAYSPTLTA